MCFFFSSRRRHTRWPRDWSSDVCSSDLKYKSQFKIDFKVKTIDDKYLIIRTSKSYRHDRAKIFFYDFKIGRASCRERVLMLAVACDIMDTVSMRPTAMNYATHDRTQNIS